MTKTSCHGKYTIRDPYTQKCLKLSLKGTVYNRYVVPFMLGERSFLSLFSKKDQYKFMSFLKKHMLLPIHDRPYYSKKSRSSSRTSLKERMIDYLVHVMQPLFLTRDRETSKTDFEQ